MLEPSRWGVGLLAVAALGLSLQVGLVRVSRHDALEAELALLRREALRTELRLSHQLRSARAQSQRLRDGLERRAALAAALEGELAGVRIEAEALEARAARAADALRQEPPPLDLSLATDAEGGALRALAENAGQGEIYIVDSEARLWIGDREQPLAAGAGDLAVGPGEELDFLEFPLFDLAEGAADVRGVLCAVYERSLDGVSTAWAREIWFEVRPEVAGAAVVEQYRWSPAPEEAACDLSSASSPGP